MVRNSQPGLIASNSWDSQIHAAVLGGSPEAWVRRRLAGRPVPGADGWL